MRPYLFASLFIVASSLVGVAEAQVYREERPNGEFRRDDNFRRDDPRREARRAQPNDFMTRLRTYRFADVMRPTPLPRSRGAAMCALTTVDDDSPEGWCKVFFDEQLGEWMSQTGGREGDQNCEATCMWMGPRADDDEVRDRPRFRRYE